MTNGEKFKTPEERADAFNSYCKKGIIRCAEGPSCVLCKFKWLELEAEEEKPLPCPFCGSETFYANDRGIIYCKVCEYRSNKYKWSHEAIAAHNRVARAVMAEKEKEAK